jgi:LPS export ABC transporter protein LptC
MQPKVNILIYLTIILAFSCSKVEMDGEDTSDELKEGEIWNPIIILSREGTRLVKAKSDKLYKNSNEMALLVGNVVVDLYNEEGNHISILYSDSARINEQNNNLYAKGNVYVVSDSGYTLTTSALVWDNRYEMIVAEDSVMFTHTEGDTLYGIGFESDIDLERFKIFKPFGTLRGGI